MIVGVVVIIVTVAAAAVVVAVVVVVVAVVLPVVCCCCWLRPGTIYKPYVNLERLHNMHKSAGAM